jgi:hypothetical protein
VEGVVVVEFGERDIPTAAPADTPV